MFKRSEYDILIARLEEPRKFIQVLTGPRQVGKTTVLEQVSEYFEKTRRYVRFVSCDKATGDAEAWLSSQWQTVRMDVKESKLHEAILVFDEIQKIKDWSRLVKAEYDEDTRNKVPIKVVLLGSSRVLLQKGLGESLFGRFEEIRMTHWNYPEAQSAFAMTLDEYLYFGCYPGAVQFISNERRFCDYVSSAIIDTTIAKDILFETNVRQPALLRQTVELGGFYSGECLSLTKLIGQMQDVGNTTTVSGYLSLLRESGLIAGLNKFSIDMARRRASSPKFQVFNSAIRAALRDDDFAQVKKAPSVWGRIVESGIGAWLLSESFKKRFDLYYWQEGNNDVDFVLRHKQKTVALEVKSNTESANSKLEYFRNKFPGSKTYLVGKKGIPLETFLKSNVLDLF